MQQYISVRADIRGALAKLDAAGGDHSKRAIVRALNKTVATGRAQAAREIRQAGYGLRIGDIKDAFSVRRASTSALRAFLRARGKPIPLMKYSARQTKRGVSVAVKNGRKVIAHAFVATMPSGHEGVFLRVGNEHKRVTRRGRVIWSGLPLRELFGPSIPSAFANDVVQKNLITLMRTRFVEVLRQELRYEAIK